MSDAPAHRLLLVHAHPDDESIGQGATMAKYVAEGRGVTLVTCTAGEMGEILVPELEHLAADRDDGLGEHRRGELEQAMKALGVTDHRFLGGFGTYRDSGMAWHADGHAIAADEVHDNAFWHADLTEAADHLVPVVREVRPQVLVTYDQFGGYGHPDHIQAHRVAMYAAQLAAVPSYRRDLGRAVGHREDLLGRDVGDPDARGPAGAARGRRHDDVRGDGPRRAAASVRDRRREPRVRRRRPGPRRARRWPRWPPTPPRSRPTVRSSRSPTTSAATAWGVEYYRIVKGGPGTARRGRSGDRPVRRPVTRTRCLECPTCAEVVTAAACLIAGALVSVASIALHSLWWGLLLVALTLAAALWALPAGWWTRLAFGLGWLGALVLLLSPRPEGDYVVSSDVNGYALMGFGLVVLMVAVATLPRSARGDDVRPDRLP